MSSSSLWQDKAKTFHEKRFNIISVEWGKRAAADFPDLRAFPNCHMFVWILNIVLFLLKCVDVK